MMRGLRVLSEERPRLANHKCCVQERAHKKTVKSADAIRPMCTMSFAKQ